MSLSINLVTNDYIVMAGDSRGCIECEGKKYVVLDNVKKIKKIGNFVMFFTGLAWVADTISSMFEKLPNELKTILSLQRICIEVQNDYFKRCKANGENPYLSGANKDIFMQIVVSGVARQYNLPIAYVLQDCNDYKPLQVSWDKKGLDCYSMISSGHHSDEGSAYIENLYNNGLLKTDADIFKAYKKVYTDAVNEQVGGVMDMYILKSDGSITNYKFNIPDEPNLNRAKIDNLGHIHFDPKNGIKISNLQTNQDTFYLDTIGNLHIKGTLEACSGSFSGTVNAGEIISSKIIGSDIEGTAIDGSDITGGKIQ